MPVFMICQAGTEFMDLMKLKLNSFIENYLPVAMRGPNIFYLYNTRYNEKTELNAWGHVSGLPICYGHELRRGTAAG